VVNLSIAIVRCFCNNLRNRTKGHGQIFLPLAIWPCRFLSLQIAYTLNDTGLCIWEGLCQGQPVQAISQQLAASYDLTVEQAQPYVMALVSELLAERLVTPLGERDGTPV